MLDFAIAFYKVGGIYRMRGGLYDMRYARAYITTESVSNQLWLKAQEHNS
jgi:hypothetical protein